MIKKLMIVIAFTISYSQETSGIFFSEVAEGSANNKYLEIYNGTGADLDLSNYSLSTCSNGCDGGDEFDYPNNVTFNGITLEDGDVYVVCHTNSSDEIDAECDQTFQFLSNGDDFYALTLSGATASTYTVIDKIGDFGNDPGSGWDVAGVTNGTKDHTLVRRGLVTNGNTDWVASAGTNEEDSEWIVLDQNTWDYLGSHPHQINTTTVVVNEFLASTGDCCLFDGSTEDFVELYNYGNAAVDISGWGFSDTDGEVATLAPEGTSIAAGEFLILWYTGDSDGFPEIDSKLSGDGEEIHIADADGNTIILIEFGEQTDDISYGRVPDGEDTWVYIDPPTPGETNELVLDITTIYEIQYVEDPAANDESPLLGQEVSIHGIVTAEFWGSYNNRQMFVQDAEGPWNGIQCYRHEGWHDFDWVDVSGLPYPSGPAEGDEVTLTGTVTSFSDGTQLGSVTLGMVHGPADQMIMPSVITLNDIGEAYEGCLIALVDVHVDSENPDDPDEFGEWSVSDGTNSVRVDDKWDYYYYPKLDQQLAYLEGVLDHNYGNFKIQPRLARDVVEEGPARIQRIQQVLHSDLMKTAQDSESDISYMLGEEVTIEGVVTMPVGLSYAGTADEEGIPWKFLISDVNGGPWSSLMVYNPGCPECGDPPNVYEGDLWTLTGNVYEFSTTDVTTSNLTELDITTVFDLLDVNQPLPEAPLVTTGDLRSPTSAEQWEGVMVRAEDATVTANQFTYELFEIDDGTGKVRVDDDSQAMKDYYNINMGGNPLPPVGSLVQWIEGWVYNHYGNYGDSTAYRLDPLYPEDMEFGAGPPIISNTTREPCAPTLSDNEVSVSCIITDNSTISEALIYYSIDGGNNYSTVTMTEDESLYTGVIPFSDASFVYYYFSATDDGADQAQPKTSTFPFDLENAELGFHVTDNFTIQHVQETPFLSGVGFYEGCTVTVSGVVTGDIEQFNSWYSAYALQDGVGQWNGLVFDTGVEELDVTRGDEITVTGMVTNSSFDPTSSYKFDGNTRLVNPSVVVGESIGEPAPMAVSCEDLSQDAEEVESYEGVLVKLDEVTVVSVNEFDWSVTDATGAVALIDDDMANMEADNMLSALIQGQQLESVMGIFNYSFGTYKIQIRDAADLGTTVGIDKDVHVNPFTYELHDNFPNPFNPETHIRFSIGGKENVKLIIYDIMGQQVRSLINGESYTPGFHAVHWNGLDNDGQKVPSGMYIYRIKAGSFVADKKMLLLK